jgi:hypothetical protein
LIALSNKIVRSFFVTQKILIAEDNLLILDIYIIIFERSGFTPYTASTPAKAMEIIEKENIKHVLIDGTGWDKAIQYSIDRGCTVVIQSGKSEDFTHFNVPLFKKEEGLNVVVDEFLRLSKLVNKELLLEPKQ